MQDINKTDKQIEAFFIDKRKEYSQYEYGAVDTRSMLPKHKKTTWIKLAMN